MRKAIEREALGLTEDAEELFKLAGVHDPGFRETTRRFAEQHGDEKLGRNVLRSLASRRPDPFVNQIVSEEAARLGIDVDPDIKGDED